MAGSGQRRKTKSRFPSRSPLPSEIAAAIPTFPPRHGYSHSLADNRNEQPSPNRLRKAPQSLRYSPAPFRPILRLENASGLTPFKVAARNWRHTNGIPCEETPSEPRP